MKNYRFLVMIGMVALLGGSVYKTYDSRKTLNDNYESAIEDARENRKLGVWVNAEEDYLNAIDIKDNVDVRVDQRRCSCASWDFAVSVPGGCAGCDVSGSRQ